MKESRIEQIKSAYEQQGEQALRDKIQHLTTEIELLGETEETKDKQLLLDQYRIDLSELEERKPKASQITFQGRVTIELSKDDGFYLYTEEDGNIEWGKYWHIEWGVTREDDLLDAELQQVMDYFNIDDNTYKIRG
jgi:hypothetical protein